MKVVIEIDRMPEICRECQFVQYKAARGWYCNILQGMAVNPYNKNANCPLKPLEENENAE